MKAALQIFYSYSHDDKELLVELRKHLAPLRKKGVIEEWWDEHIAPGDELHPAISLKLESADIIVLLVSASYLASQSCEAEWHRALKRERARDARALPVIARPCIWGATDLARLKVLPEDGKAVTLWNTPDEAWTDVARGIERLIETDPRFLYRRLCTEGRSSLVNQTVEVAPFLDEPESDKRLGLTLIVRPSPDVSDALARVNDRLRAVAPENFYYDPARFHFTILSLINAAAPPAIPGDLVPRFRQVIADVLRDSRPFRVTFAGVCPTRSSVIAKGFPADDSLERIRAALRFELTAAGLGAGLDERYPSRGAHVTLARFKVNRPARPLVELLDQLRGADLGDMSVGHAQLVENDFYMSATKVRLIAGLPLGREEVAPESEPAAPPAAGPVRHNLPIMPPNFVGRGADLQYILDSLCEAYKPVIVTSGFGGIGKSALARMIAWTCVRRRSPFDFIAWVDVRQYETSQTVSLDFVLNAIAKVADASSDILSVSHLEEKKNRVTELLKRYRSLLIVDNYESLLSDISEEQKVSAFLGSLPIGSPTCGGDSYIRVLVTTRELSARLRDLPIDNVELEKLSPADSITLMKARTPPRLKLTDAQYRRVWEILCGLPKYMQIAIDQLRTMKFEQWEKMVTDIKYPLDESEHFFRNLFENSWQRFAEEFKKLLLSMTYFVGAASPDALQKTSGLSESKFLSSMAHAPGTGLDAYIEGNGDGYTVHPLTHAFCRAVLDEPQYGRFRRDSGLRFVRYFSEYAKAADEGGSNELLEREMRNITAAANLAAGLSAWPDLIDIGRYSSKFLRLRGYWRELTEVAQLVVTACGRTGQDKVLGEFLIDYLGWLFLRFEDLESAEKCIGEGLRVFERLEDRDGIAQATRHLGKLELLRGLDPFYKPSPASGKYFDKAGERYTTSLRIRETLQAEGLDQRERIADMKLDFGRLYWLEGQMYEPQDGGGGGQECAEKALKKYEASNAVSREAMRLFEEIQSERGIAKAWGNLGNATKATAKFFLRHGPPGAAAGPLTRAHEFYEKSLVIAGKIRREDEIAHAAWGLAEVHEILARHPRLHGGAGERGKLLAKALGYAKSSHKIYMSLGGRKDISATSELVTRIEAELARP
jgi:2'-5' RNA ligase/tetratricopeptide (TPR) repeat protein